MVFVFKKAHTNNPYEGSMGGAFMEIFWGVESWNLLFRSPQCGVVSSLMLLCLAKVEGEQTHKGAEGAARRMRTASCDLAASTKECPRSD